MILCVPPVRARILLGCLLIASLSLTMSCDNDQPSGPCPPGRVGAVEGYLFAGGVPMAAEIGARCGDGPAEGEVRFLTTSDSTGWYRLEMPVGAYGIEAPPACCITIGPVRDTIHVGSGIRHFDIFKGRVTVRLLFPRALAGRRLWVTVSGLRDSGVIGEDGAASFFFPLVAPGEYPIGIQFPYTYQEIYLPGTLDRDAALRVVVPADHPLVYEDNLESSATISGSLTGSWQGLDVGRPSVTALATSDSSRVGTAEADENGDFLLVLLQARPVKLLSDVGDVERWFGGDDYGTATTFNPDPGGHLSGASMTDGGIIFTFEPATPSTEIDARIVIRDEGGRTWTIGSWGSRTVVCNLRGGRYYVRADCWCSSQHPTWANQWYDGASSLAEATPVEVVEGQAVPITFHLVEGAKIEGLVLEADGTPAQRTRLGLFDQDLEPDCVWRWTDTVAAFEFAGLADGDYYLAARLNSGSSWWYPGTTEPDSAQAISIRDRVSVTGVTWRLPPDAGRARP